MICSVCGQETKNKSALRNHYKSAHPDFQPFQCNICSTKFAHAASLQRHKKLCGIKPNIKLDTKSQIEPCLELDKKLDQQTETKLQLEPEMESQLESEMESPLESEMESPLEPEIESPLEPESQIEPKVGSQLEPTIRAEVDQIDTKSQLEIKSQLEPQAKTKSQLETKPQPETKSQSKKSKIGTEILVSSGEHKLFQKPVDYRCVEFSSVHSFDEWLTRYRNLTSTTKDTPLADSVQKQMTTYLPKVLLEHPELFEVTDSVVGFGEKLDEYIDQQIVLVQLSTVVQRLRYLRWYFCYLISSQAHTNLEILHELDDQISNMQTASSNNTTNNSLLHILDPYRLAQLANRLVGILNQLKVNILDPFMLQYFRTPQAVSHEELTTFGLDHLRVFLELGMRLTNVPCRIECTKYLRMDTYAEPDFVSKLVLGQHHLSRLINQDKNGKVAQVTLIPLDATLSGYLWFYVRFCRPVPSSSWVFQAKNGGLWRTASKDLKAFLGVHGIDCSEICPNGRLIHGTRHLGLAVYSILANFDIEKIRNYSTLMRHQLLHVEHIYSPWLKMYQNKAAVQDMITLRQWPSNPLTEKNSGFTIQAMQPPHHELKIALAQLLQSTFAGLSELTEQGFQDASTQTADPEVEESRVGELTNQPSDQMPVCAQCRKSFLVLGPVGLSRHKRYGQFYRQCGQCDGLAPGSASQWYKLGTKPTIKSSSTKPRNIEAINNYITLFNKKIQF